MARFEELEVWKRAAQLSADLYTAFAEVKDFGFRDQITRAGLSVPSNVDKRWLAEAEEISKMLHALIRTIHARKT